MQLETPRLILREMTQFDYDALRLIVCDEQTMHAYVRAYTDDEAREWLNTNLRRYRKDGYGLLAVVLKSSGEMIGQCGLTNQLIGERTVLEVGYILRRDYWHKGYAFEAARACRDYAFEVLGASEVYSIIRDNNAPSIRVAERMSMTAREKIIKTFRGEDLPHTAFSITREEWLRF